VFGNFYYTSTSLWLNCAQKMTLCMGLKCRMISVCTVVLIEILFARVLSDMRVKKDS